MSSILSRAEKAFRITGLPLGPFPVGVRTVQIDGDPKKRQGRNLQTEIWYPTTDDAVTTMSVTKFSDYIGLDTCNDPSTALSKANAETAIGGYRDGITVEELDDPERSTWLSNAIRNAPPLNRNDGDGDASSSSSSSWPLVVFSHGSGAYRASYSYWTEFLASHGYVVAACDHPGSARYTVVDGEVITPGGRRSVRTQMEHDRPLDVIQIIDGFESASSSSSSWNNNDLDVDTSNVAVTGMSFGGYTAAATLEFHDPRIKAAVMMCPSTAKSGTQTLHTAARTNKQTPVMVMIGTEDTVLGVEANDGNRRYVDNHSDGDAYLLEILKGGHVSFTSCEMYDPEYGNGIATTNTQCKSLTQPGGMYNPLDIVKQHEIINNYGLEFLNKYMKKDGDGGGSSSSSTSYLETNHYPDDIIFRSKPQQPKNN